MSANTVKEIKLIVSEKAQDSESNDEAEGDEEILESDESDDLEIGTKIDLSPKKDDEEQLGLF